MILNSRELVSLVSRVFPDGLFFTATTEPLVALTIDDVGDPSTEIILDAITQQNQIQSDSVRATFFITTDFLRGSYSILQKILDQGHELGNHGVYDRAHADLNPEEFEQEFQQAHQELVQNTTATLKWFRPARGRYNKAMLESVRRIGGYYPQVALASMLPLDTYEFSYDPQFTARYVSRFIFPGSILVFHGGSEIRARNTAVALQQTLAYLQANRYRVVTLTDLFQVGTDCRSLMMT
ncbi:MAG: polysaccharide deacetylase family protein [Microcoleaceae cyanobacterium]